MLKIISCAGFGNTGSSIVTDFFQEFSIIRNIKGSDLEFTLLYESDGIKDLENILIEGDRLKTDLGIKRFLKLINSLNYNNPSGPNYNEIFNGKFIDYTKDYLNSLNVIEWKKGWWHRVSEVDSNKNFLHNLKREKFNYKLKKFTYKAYETNNWKPSYTGYNIQYYCNIDENEFVQKTKQYLNRLFSEIIEKDDEYLLFDQLFPVNVDYSYLKYFDFAKVIIVDRDPRDLYFLNKVFWGSGYIPTENINIFIKWFKRTRNNVHCSENIIKINFEDMIYNTYGTQLKLCNFIGIDINEHNKKNTRLFINNSIKNTQTYLRYILPEEQATNINRDIKIIENDLKEYLYSFPKKNLKKESIYQEYLIEDFYNDLELSFSEKALYTIKVFIKKTYRIVKSLIYKK